MNLGSALKVLLRRWLVVLVGLLLTLGAAGYVYTSTPQSYVASARILLLLPNDARGPDAIGSPFLYLPTGLEVLAGLIAGTPATRDFQFAQAEQGLTSQVEVVAEPRSPMVSVQVTGTNPRDVLATRDWVLETLQFELRQLQEEEGAPRSQIAHGRVFAAENVPRSAGNVWMRPVLVVGAVGGIITLLAAFAIDHLIQRRSRRREEASSPEVARSTEPEAPAGSAGPDPGQDLSEGTGTPEDGAADD